MTEIEFCVEQCGELTSAQIKMVNHHVNQGTFIGIASPIGRSKLMPLVTNSTRRSMSTILPSGYYGDVSLVNRYNYQPNKINQKYPATA